MLGWAYLGVEKYGRGDSETVAKRLDWLPRWFIKGLTDAKLVSTLRHVWRNSPAQRERWKAAGIRLKDIRTPEILRDIPFLTGDQLAANPEEFLCAPREELIHVIATSGTKGNAKRVFFTAEDMARQTTMIGTSLRRLPGASRVLTTYRMKIPTWPAGIVSWQGILKAGMLGLAAGTETSVEEQIKLIRDYHIDVVMGGPSYIHRITLEAQEDLKKLGVKYLLLCGQAWTEECRRELEAAWGAKALDVYGTNECGCGIASECPKQKGLHISEADFYTEIVDPKTGKQLEDGERGEIVVTTLSRKGMPLVRYRIGDLAHVLPMNGPCECGLHLRSLSRIKGRVDDMVILGNGVNVYPNEIDEAVLGARGVTDYQLVIEKNGYRDVLNLTVENASTGTNGTLEKEMWGALRKVDAIREAIDETKLVELGKFCAIPRGVLSMDRVKSVRIVDKRG